MVKELNAAELDLLARIKDKKELLPYFFRKAKGLKWFDSLDEAGYFDATENSPPAPAKEEGYVSIPHWPVTDYLVATSPELLVEANHAYAERVLEIIRTVTQSAKKEGFGNSHTWLKFSKIIQNVPVECIKPDDLKCVDYWLEDKYETDLVAGELGEKWLNALLAQPVDKAKKLALGLLRLLYKVSFHTKRLGDSEYQEAVLRYGKSDAKEITNSVAQLSGQALRQDAVKVFLDEYRRVDEKLQINDRSSLWHPAIEDNEQNRNRDNVENILIIGLRDSLSAWVQVDPEKSANYIADLLKTDSNMLKRIAIHSIRVNFNSLFDLTAKVIEEEFFEDDFRHEMWHLLHDHYPRFSEPVRQRVLKIVNQQTVEGDDDAPSAERTAYRQAIWLSALRNHDERLQARYRECVENAGAEPDHPDFSIYLSSGVITHESPLPTKKMLSIGIDDLIGYLENYENPGYSREPGLKGLVNALKAAVKSNPMKFAPKLKKFAGLDCAYIYVLIDAFSELWSEKKELPWSLVWQNLLDFCKSVINREKFWSPENAEKRAAFVANSHSVISSIGRLIENGTKSDDHAFSAQLLDQAKTILLTLIERETSVEFKPDSDAVSIAINSPRGRCLEGLINLALRTCRLADEEGAGHDAAWQELQPIFDVELSKPDQDEYEFITLLVNYLPNFLYMSEEWVLANLTRIFDRENYQKWLCAIQGYAYVNRFYPEIFGHLKANQHYLHALDDENLKEKVSERIIEAIGIAFLNGHESLDDDDSLIRELLSRGENDELSQLIWFIWTLRKEDDEALYTKVIELWPLLLDAIDTENREGRKVASRLATWSVFVTEVDDTNRELLSKVAAFAEDDYNSRDLLRTIARISAKQPGEAVMLWKALLQNSAPDYPEEAIQAAFANLVGSGDNGRREATAIADEYIRRGKERPHILLREILEQ